ncbi:SecDF P1 head subdomain-containing protein [Legionella sp. D16C41]|uniref:SecDF P1 head subdomain-containing protein n=1 Tax=Legionella sp. D16C41 TaxID=3402688 RepID=UPI003AF6C62E
MHIFIKTILAALAITIYSTAIASQTTTAASSMKAESQMVFQVVQSQLVIDSSMVESAKIISPEKPSDSYGLQLKLKSTAANELTRISNENIGKHMNLILGNIVISSPIIQSELGAEFQITGLTKEQAEQFIKSLSLVYHYQNDC